MRMLSNKKNISPMIDKIIKLRNFFNFDHSFNFSKLQESQLRFILRYLKNYKIKFLTICFDSIYSINLLFYKIFRQYLIFLRFPGI